MSDNGTVTIGPHVEATPGMAALRMEWDSCTPTTDTATIDQRDTRLMRWDGQSADGRKRREVMGTDPLPWEGAFDTRIPTVDSIINMLVAILLEVFSRAPIRCKPTEIGDIDTAGKLQKIVEYYRGIMSSQLRDELELLLQDTWTYGAALVYPSWERRLGTTKAHLTMDDIEAIALAPENSETPLAAIVNLIATPGAEKEAAKLLLFAVPDLQTVKAAEKAVRALMAEGVAEYRRPFVVANRPCVRALRYGRDVFVPPGSREIQRVRVVFIRELLNEVEVRERVKTDGWDEEWAEAAIATAGRITIFDTDDATQKLGWTTVDTNQNDIEVVTAYYRQLDDQDIPCLMMTVFSPQVSKGRSQDSELWAVHKPADLAHQQYPLVEYQTERLTRTATDARGVPDVAYTWQAEEKTQCDMLCDLASISVNPPRRTSNTRGQKYEWGPGAQSVGREGDLQAFQVPTTNAPLAFQITEMIRRRKAEYYGIMDETIPPALWQTRMQAIIGRFTASVQEMFRQITALIMDPANVSTEELERITGLQMQDVDRSPEAIVMGYDWEMKFDAKDLDQEFLLNKLRTVSELAVPQDREGTIIYSQLVEMIMRLIDPGFASVIRTPQAASDQIKRDVDAELVRMAAGNEANYTVDDPAAGAKMEALNQIITANPKYSEAYNRDERFRAVVDNYLRNLKQSIVQEQNVEVGKTGVKPLNQ